MDLRDILKKYNAADIVIAGYGYDGKYLLHEIQKLERDYRICFCDNAKVKQGTDNDVEILSFEDAVCTYPNALYLISSTAYGDRMKRQLAELGIAENRIVFEEIYSYLKELMEEHIVQRKLTPHSLLRLEVSLAEHCNLNCKHCAHFSSVAEPEFMDIRQYEKDMERMSQLLDGKSDKIYLLGGEPLLYPDIIPCMEITRRCFPKSMIVVLTNGLLIQKMEDAFWEVCRQNDIYVNLTKYPIKLNYDKIEKKIADEGVASYYLRESDKDCSFNKYGMDLKGEQDAYDSFTHCNMANQCHLLREGKIYTCSVIGCIQHFNRYFNQNLEVTEDDYVDIYAVKDGQELLEKLSKPAPFCRYCDVRHRTEGLPFEISKKEMSEWV